MDTEQAIVELQNQVKTLQQSVALPTHYHNGFDSNQIAWLDLYQKNIYLHHTVQGTSAATSTNYSTFFIATTKCLVTGVQEVHQTAGTDGGSVTLLVEKLTGTTAPGGGVSVLNSTFSLKASINTVRGIALTKTNANRVLNVGDRLALKSSGVLTSVANVTVLITLQI